MCSHRKQMMGQKDLKSWKMVSSTMVVLWNATFWVWWGWLTWIDSSCTHLHKTWTIRHDSMRLTSGRTEPTGMWRRQHGIARKRNIFILHCIYVLNYQHLKHIHTYICIYGLWVKNCIRYGDRLRSYSSSYHTIVWRVYCLGVFSYPLNIVTVGSALTMLFRQHF